MTRRNLIDAAVVALCAATLAIASAGAVAAQEGAPRAEAKILDKVVAVVDDEVVLLGDLLSDLQAYMMQTGRRLTLAEQEKLLDESLENRIREKMLIAKARRDEVQIGEDELDAAMDQHIKRLQDQAGGAARFQRELERENLTERALRKRLKQPMREQIMVQRVLEQLSYGVEVKPSEVRAFYDQNKGDEAIIPLRPSSLQLSHILVRPTADPERSDTAKAKLAEVERRLAAGEEFAAVAEALSEGPAAKRGGDMGWFNVTDIALPVLAQALSGMAVGEVRRDIVSQQGLHVLKLEERQGAQVRFRQIFLPLPVEEADRRRSRDRARAAWRKLQDGADWKTIVAEYSDDSLTRDEGGMLPLLAADQLDERYRSVIEVLEPGEYSGVFLAEQGYEIVRLVEREVARPFRYDEISEQLRAELLNRKRSEALDLYVEELRGELLIEKKGIPSLPEIAGLGETP